ncbi:MAG: hypothetical protein RL728_126, partial [Bacteroidota bacterium]
MQKIKCCFADDFSIPRILIEKYEDVFERVRDRHLADVIFDKYIPQKGITQTPKAKTIYIFTRGRGLHAQRDRNVWRTIDVTDKHFIEQYPRFDGITFCRYDVHPQENMIRVPLNHMPYNRISQDKDYFRQVPPIDQTGQFFNRCFWRGGETHIIRDKIILFLKEKNDSRFDLEFWKAKTGTTYNDRAKAPKAWEYNQYFIELQKSDAALCIRGDSEWIYSFFDIIRAGIIPICINTGYSHLGWEKIGIDYNNLFLSYDISSKDSVQGVYDGINSLLNDKERCRKMKTNLRKFYEEIYLTDRGLDLYLLNEDPPINPIYPVLCGWGDFFAG